MSSNVYLFVGFRIKVGQLSGECCETKQESTVWEVMFTLLEDCWQTVNGASGKNRCVSFQLN
jgi:hypothetical protein